MKIARAFMVLKKFLKFARAGISFKCLAYEICLEEVFHEKTRSTFCHRTHRFSCACMRSGGRVWIETYRLSSEQWISFNTEGMSFHVPAAGFGISAAAFVLFSICLTLLIIEMTRARS